MLRSYLKIAFRNLLKNKTYSVINIAGLSAGMAVAMLIGLWIYDEVSYDHYHKNYDRIAKIREHVTVNGVQETGKAVPYPLADELRNQYGNYFKYVVRSSHRMNHILSTDNKQLTWQGIYLEPAAPRMFSLKLINGSPDGLQDPSSVLLAASVAKALFGDADPMNKAVTIDSREQVKVTGVYEDLPANSTLANVKFIAPFELYVRGSGWVQGLRGNWDKDPVQAYVQLADGADMDKISALIKDIKLKKLDEEKARFQPALFLEPMSKWHLYEEYRNGVNTGGKIRYVWMFGFVGVFVLLLACINFMNLSTARSEKRAKEVGVHKAIGSLRSQLISRFYCESILVTMAAFVVSLLLVQAILPFFNEVAAKKITILWGHPLFWVAGISFSVLTGLIAGSYPALYLSSFQAVKVLKGTFRVGRLAALPRKALVVVQFTVSVILIIGTVIVFRQVQFGKERATGYNQEGLVVLPLHTDEINNHFEAVRETLLKEGAVTAMALAQGPSTDLWGTETALSWKGKDPHTTVDFPLSFVGVDYGKTLGWQFIRGRDFSRDYNDSLSIVINEAAVQFMGFKEPVGETIYWGQRPYTIVGVIKDMIMESPYEPVKPSLFVRSDAMGGFVFAKLNPAVSAATALSSLERVFKQYTPAAPFEYKFVDEEYGRKFSVEERVGKLTGFFTVLAIFISCLGLFGLASFVAEQRTKEIGIRKVLGASVLNVWKLLSAQFVILVVIALLIAIPIAYYAMHQWLQNYTYRSTLSGWIFIATGAGALLLTLLTVSFQAIKAALINPAKSLKTE
jgi:ABC-type antimicrobial peptide transport system permease subunit